MLSLQNGAGDYKALLERLKSEIRTTQLQATIAAKTEFLAMYWRIGRIIVEQEKQQGWGQKVVVRLVADLKTEFPNMKDMSPRNLRYMKSFAAAYPNDPFGENPILQVGLAKLTWYHHLTLLDKVAEYSLRDFHKPIGITEYRLLESLPDDLKSTLPSIEEIEERLRLDELPEQPSNEPEEPKI